MAYSSKDFIRAADLLAKELTNQVEEIRERRRQHQQTIAELQEMMSTTMKELLLRLLPTLSESDVARASRLAAYNQILQNGGPRAALEAERVALENEQQALAAQPNYRDRVLLRAPRIGSQVRQLAELEEFQAAFQPVLRAAEHPRLMHLLESGYDTDKYTGGWWRLSYYADWKAGDEILEKFPDKKSFREVRAEVLRAMESEAEFADRIAAVKSVIAEGKAMEARFDEISAKLPQLESLHLASWHRTLEGHLQATDLLALSARAQGEPELELLMKTAAGLRKKIEYLEQIVATTLDPKEASLRKDLEKLARDRVKYSRPKNAHVSIPDESFRRRFRERNPERQKFWKRYDRNYQTVSRFDGYAMASPVQDFLWWDLMTDGQLDGNFVPEVSEHRQQFPTSRYVSTKREDDESYAASVHHDSDASSSRFVDAS